MQQEKLSRYAQLACVVEVIAWGRQLERHQPSEVFVQRWVTAKHWKPRESLQDCAVEILLASEPVSMEHWSVGFLEGWHAET